MEEIEEVMDDDYNDSNSDINHSVKFVTDYIWKDISLTQHVVTIIICSKGTIKTYVDKNLCNITY